MCPSLDTGVRVYSSTDMLLTSPAFSFPAVDKLWNGKRKILTYFWNIVSNLKALKHASSIIKCFLSKTTEYHKWLKITKRIGLKIKNTLPCARRGRHETVWPANLAGLNLAQVVWQLTQGSFGEDEWASRGRLINCNNCAEMAQLRPRPPIAI